MREYKGLSAEVGPALVLVIISKSNFSTLAMQAMDGMGGSQSSTTTTSSSSSLYI